MSFVSIKSLRPAAHIVAAVAIAAATPLVASAHAITVNKVVSYADLNLSTQAGIAGLYARLRSAADLVCGHYDSRDLKLRHLRDACYAEALAGAVAKVDHSAVTALHRADRSVRLARRAADAGRRT